MAAKVKWEKRGLSSNPMYAISNIPIYNTIVLCKNQDEHYLQWYSTVGTHYRWFNAGNLEEAQAEHILHIKDVIYHIVDQFQGVENGELV